MWRGRYQCKLDSNGWTLCWWVNETILIYNFLFKDILNLSFFCIDKWLTMSPFQPPHIPNPYQSWWIWFFPCSRTTSIHWTSCWTQSRPSEIQFLYVRIRFGFGEIGCTTGIRSAYQSNLFSRSWRSVDWWKCYRHRLGTVEWRWYIAVSFTRGRVVFSIVCIKTKMKGEKFYQKFKFRFFIRFWCLLLAMINVKKCSYEQDEMNLFQKYSFVLDMKPVAKILVIKIKFKKKKITLPIDWFFLCFEFFQVKVIQEDHFK